MTIEELMKPRYKVVDSFPFNKFYKVGDILTDDGKTVVTNQDGEVMFACEFNNYPNVFQSLEWWEERKIEDMPKYLKQTGMVDGADEPIPDWYLKVKKHFNAGNGEWRDDSIHIFCIERCERTMGTNMRYSGFEPATEQEYTTYIQSQLKR